MNTREWQIGATINSKLGSNRVGQGACPTRNFGLSPKKTQIGLFFTGLLLTFESKGYIITLLS